MSITYLNALAGAGKTRALVQYAHKMAAIGEAVLFVQPSKLLIEATFKTEVVALQPRYSVAAIHSGNTEQVVRQIVAHMNAAAIGTGQVLFVTHEAFLRLPEFDRKRHWRLIFDEVPGVDLFEAINVPDTHSIITDAIEIRQHDAAYGQLLPQEDRAIRRIAYNPRDDKVWSLFSGLAHRIASPHWQVFSLQSNYHALLRQEQDSHQLVTHSLLQPSIFRNFKDVIIASALFEESCLYQLWARQGVEFQQADDQITTGLRYRQHHNGELIAINYVTAEDWSKTLRDRQLKPIAESRDDRHRSLRDELPKLIRAALGENAFAWLGNKDIDDDYFGPCKAVRLPNSPHGLNSFQNLHHVVAISALNPPPAHFRFMETRGIDARALRTSHYRSAVYQAAMRISIRNPGDRNPKSITVMDNSTAVWLADLFPGAKVQALEGLTLTIAKSRPGRPKRYASNADRMQAYRDRQRTRKERLTEDIGLPGFGTAYASIFDVEPLLDLDAADEATFIALLKELHGRTIAAKDKNFLFTPASFDPDAGDAGTKRGLSNIRHMRGIWLDNDGGDLSHDQFAKMFPQLRMVVWNTYSSTAASPRWRCYIPTATSLSADAYRAIIGQIVQLLQSHGYVSKEEKRDRVNLKHHGFDTSKFTPSSLFYAPCQALDSQQSFFIEYAEAPRNSLDAELWIDNDIRSDCCDKEIGIEPSFSDAEPKADQSQAVRVALENWRAAPRGEGHSRFFRLAKDLERAGLSRDEYARQLYAEAGRAASPRDRRAEAKRLVGRYWRQ